MLYKRVNTLVYDYVTSADAAASLLPAMLELLDVPIAPGAAMLLSRSIRAHHRALQRGRAANPVHLQGQADNACRAATRDYRPSPDHEARRGCLAK
ncbi:MAG: hypothetical protein EXR98_03025 [Gemmataceae bacterium]|nr:hypothetical protein [Gemmataceae bacterium]